MAIDGYKYEKREGTHGVSFGAFADIVTQEEGGALDTTTVPSPFTGLRTCSFETTQESNPFYADNVEHLRLMGAKTTEGTITCYQFPEKFVIDHLGKKKMENTGLVDTGKAKNFIWQFIETVEDEFGNTYRMLNVYYNVKASPPTGESTTDEDAVELKEFEIPVTASPNPLVVDDAGNAVTYMTIKEDDTNKALFDLAYKQIILPTTPISGVDSLKAKSEKLKEQV